MVSNGTLHTIWDRFSFLVSGGRVPSGPQVPNKKNLKGRF